MRTHTGRFGRLATILLAFFGVGSHAWAQDSSDRSQAAALEIITVPMASEHFLRRPRTKVERRPFTIERVERFKLGLVERLVAQKNR